MMMNQFKKIYCFAAVIVFIPSIFYGFIDKMDTCMNFIKGNTASQYESSFYLYAAESSAVTDYSETEESSVNFTADGFIEIENYYSSDKNRSKKDRNLKNELRANLEIKAGSENIYLYSKTNFYYIPQFKDEKAGDNYFYNEDFNVSNNLRISDKTYEIEPVELYLNYSNSLFRIRAGNQIYLWGTADLYNPTSYFNPSDYREYLFADDDELKLAVPSGSVMLFLGFATVEMVFVPVHIPSEFPAEGNYWQIQSEYPGVEYQMFENKAMDKKLSNSAYGIRSAFIAGGVDFSLSYYHGPDRNPVFVPKQIDFVPPSTFKLGIKPEYFIVNKFGADLSTQISDFVFQCEAVYSPDKTWLVKQDMSNLMAVSFPFETEKSHYIHYAAGFNYYIPVNKFIEDYDGESIITVEWQQPWYSNDDVMESLISKIFLIRFEEICFDSRLKVSISYLTEINKNADIIKPEIKYDFQNGLSVKASYVYIKAESDSDSLLPGEDTSVVYFLRDRDMGSFSIRYDF